MDNTLDSENTRPIILFGGSFDPPHCVHIMIVSYLLACMKANKIWIIPCFQHALGIKRSLPFLARFQMAQEAFNHFGPAVEVLDVESRLPQPSYSIDTLRYLMNKHPEHTFRFVIGTDIWEERHLWKEFDTLAQLAPLIILGRQGSPSNVQTVGPCFPRLSSSKIRSALSRGEDISELVPYEVVDLIRRNGWYADK